MLMPDSQLISENITPDSASADVRDMVRGLAGLPTGFTWRDQHFTIEEILGEWKRSESYNHSPGAERYYRKHYYRVRVDSGQIMTLYVLRQVKRGEDPKKRWWLYTIDAEKPNA